MELKTLGGLALIGPKGRIVPVQRRRLALLAVVALAGPRGISRERLLGIFWPDTDEERGRATLAQALYALRRDTGREDLFDGTTVLSLTPGALVVDVLAFAEEVEAGRLAEAVARWSGPFLDGFYLPDAPDFERWTEEQRAHYGRTYADALERLADSTHAAGRPRDALQLWHKLAALDPHNARVAMSLMQSAAAAGDRAAALKHAALYDRLAEADGIPRDPAVAALAEELRTGKAAEPRGHMLATAPAPPVRAATHQAAGAAAPVAVLASGYRRRMLIGVAASAVLIGAVALGLRLGRDARASPAFAVGRIHDHSGDPAVGALAEMLTTSLARVSGLSIVSTARMYELTGGDTARLLPAARHAGATVLVEGDLFRGPAGSLRFELRRTDVAGGRVIGADRVEGRDLFAVVDSATARIAAWHGGAAPALPLAAQTTASASAYRLFSEGVRAYYLRQGERARALLDAAAAEDSTFALAWQWAARAYYDDYGAWRRRMDRAVALAPRAPDRERLLILLDYHTRHDAPPRLALAESLATRYPGDPEALHQLGNVLQWDGQFLAAAGAFLRARELDRGGLAAARLGERCLACEAMGGAVIALQMADSMDAAVRIARRFTEEAPRFADAWFTLADALMFTDRPEDAYAALEMAAQLDVPERVALVRAWVTMHAEHWDSAAAFFAEEAARPEAELRNRGLWWLTIIRRQQGRLDEALALARRYIGVGGIRSPEAQVLFERGEYRAAARAFRAIASEPRAELPPSRLAREIAWHLTHTATALAAAGDTAELSRLADSVEVLGRQTAYGRDHRLHHHVRGLLYAARGRRDEAIESFRRAIFSPTGGYTRSGYELGRLLLEAGRPAEAVRALRPILRGGLQASNMYLTRTEVRVLLGRAYEAAGQADSAALHYRRAIASWSGADPAVQARRRELGVRLGS
ncbi:MAG TPA: BTAD domain-containing putative transcriptional regulator [Gemmatimonadales bacterium]|nr:BTAD domain-containing putative transcriptional regulator [Gemmatimonadales bacterium]